MKQRAPAASRNREPLCAVLADELPDAGTVLEIASGSGEHALWFSAAFPHLRWQPTDLSAEARESIAAWREADGTPNLAGPEPLDASAPGWDGAFAGQDIRAIVCINMVHISPWEASEGLFAGAGRLLPQGAPLILYGPYIEPDVVMAPSNLAFDESLKQRDPRWGLRDLATVDALALANGMVRTRRVAMPANNLTLVYRKQ
ncbi:MAG: DUF938 domain-containing protein [Novosphingobium sp.]